MELVTALHPGVFNSLKFILEYLWFDHAIHWFRAKIKRAANMRTFINGKPVSIQEVIDPSMEERWDRIRAAFGQKGPEEDAAPLRYGADVDIDIGIHPNLRTKHESHADDGDINEELRLADGNGNRTTSGANFVLQSFSCRIFLKLLPPITLIGLFLLEYATDTISKCKLVNVELNTARNNIGVLVSAFSCGQIRQGSTGQQQKVQDVGPKDGYLVEYTDSYLLGNQIVCGCTPWKDENCVQQYNGTKIATASEAQWHSSVRLSRGATQQMLLKVRARVNVRNHLTWSPLRNSELEKFVQQNGGFLECFSGNVEKNRRNNTRIDGCAYKTVQSSNFADVIIIVRTDDHVALIFNSLPIRDERNVAENFKGIIDGPTPIFRGIPIIYQAKSSSLAVAESMNIIVAGLELLVHFDIRYTASSENEGFVLSHAIVLMLSVYTRLKPTGMGMWKQCEGNVMTIAPIGTIAVISMISFTMLAFVVALITSPENIFALLFKGRALESARWAVNSMMSEKFGKKSCMTGASINGEVVLRRNELGDLHVSIVKPGGRSEICEAKEISSIRGERTRRKFKQE